MENEGTSAAKGKRIKKRDRPPHASSKEKQCHSAGEGAGGSAGESSTPLDTPSPPKPVKDVKDKPKPKPRKPKRSVSPVMIEDIVDGFAFASFKSFEDLENTVKAAAAEKEKERQAQLRLTAPPATVTVTVTHTLTSTMAAAAVTLLPTTTVPQPPLLQVNAASISVATVTTASTTVPSVSLLPLNNLLDHSNHRVLKVESTLAPPPNCLPSPSLVPKVKDKVKKEGQKKPKKDKMQSPTATSKAKVSSSSLTTATSLVSITSCVSSITPITSAVIPTCAKKEEPHLPCPQPEAAQVKVEESPTQNGRVDCNSRDRLSDVSTHSSSGRGYLGESESGDNGASDAESEPLFTPNHKAESSCHLPSPAVTLATSSRTCTCTTTARASPILSCPRPIVTSTVASLPVAPPPARRSQSPTCKNPKVPAVPHPQVHREVPKPIPGISGSRSEDERRKSLTPVSAAKPHSWASSSANAAHYPALPHRSPSTPSHLPLHHSRHTPTPSLHLGPPLTPHHPAPPPAHTHHHHPHTMFAPPLAPPPTLTSTGLPTPGGMHTSPFGTDSISPFQQSTGPPNKHRDIRFPDPFALQQDRKSGQELIRRELDRQFLDRLHQDRLPAPSSAIPPYIHQHQHQHMHQHQHTHFGSYPPSLQNSLVPPSAAHLFDKVPKLDSPFYRPNVPGLPQGYPILHPPGPTGPHLGSGIHGAFQPKNLPTSMHHTQMLINLREREKSASGPATPATPVKKSGKWCAMHVRVAWEIYHHQQKQQAEAAKSPADTKPADPLRPPNHLLPGTGLHVRSPVDLPTAPASIFGPRVAPFPRPAPYGGLGTSLGGFGGLGSSLPMPGITSPHEWNRLHRTPPSFPTPPAWPKSELERDKEKEREREREHREKEREEREKREAEREKEKERERLVSRDMERDRERDKPPESNREQGHLASRSSPVRDYRNGILESENAARHRSRSRSPVRNGPLDDHRESSSSRDSAFKNDVRIKEERKDALSELKDKAGGDLLRNDMRHSHDLLNSHAGLLPPSSLALLERSRMLGLPSYPGLERLPHPGALWSPMVDRGLDLTHHRLELQREMERERDRMLQRFPLGPMMEHERMREQQELQLRERANMEARLALIDRDRAIAAELAERSKLPMFRPGDLHPHGGLYGPRGHSPAINHNHTNSSSKSSSPAIAPTGVPPPLIPSSTTLSNSTHSRPASPTLSKARPPTPEVAAPREATINGSDTDAQSR